MTSASFGISRANTVLLLGESFLQQLPEVNKARLSIDKLDNDRQ